MARPAHDPLEPLADPAHESYVQLRAQGDTPTEAARKVGLKAFKLVERRSHFRGRLDALRRGQVEHDATITLGWLVRELKSTLSAARGSGQHKNALEAASQLAELYERHPELRGEAPAAATPAPAVTSTRQDRRATHRGRLAVVPEAGE